MEHLSGYPVSRTTYTKKNCRCKDCTSANAEYQLRSKREIEKSRIPMVDRNNKPLMREGKQRMFSMNANHGTVTGYVYHVCRCDPCTKASSLARKTYRQNKQTT